jgi:glycerate kinase
VVGPLPERALPERALPKRLLAAPDKFRGSLNAAEVASAMAAGARAAGWAARELPLSDGGEGTLGSLGGPNRFDVVTGPLGEPTKAGWRLDGDRAVVEMALASGLLLAGGRSGNDPLRATTRGTGELIAAAIAAGAHEIIVGVGGSATTDGGLGAVEAVRGVQFSEQGVVVRVACDVRTRFVDAASVFGPQKGADEVQVRALEQRLERLGDEYQRRYGVDVRALAGSGAAGGLGGGLAALGAELVPGFDLVASATGLDAALGEADAVATGEGRLDETSLEGKTVGGVAERASLFGLPVLVVAGSTAVEMEGRVTTVSLVESFGDELAWSATAALIASSTENWLLALG